MAKARARKRNNTLDAVNLKEHGSNGRANGQSNPELKTNGKRKAITSDSDSPKKTRHQTDKLLKAKKQWIINAFAMQAPCHLNPGLHKHPLSQNHKYNSVKDWIKLAQKLEAAKFHAIFFADVLGGYDVYKGPANLEPTIPAAAQFPINDPLYTVAARK
jgi:hypothetical protein